MAAVALLGLALAASCRREAAPQPAPLRFEMRRFERTLGGCGDASRRAEPCVSFHVRWAEAVDGGAAEARTRINAAVAAALQPLEAPRGFEAEAERWISDYQRFHAEFPDSSITWFARRTAEVAFSSERLLTIEVRRDEFRGGAEPDSVREFLNLSPSTGLPVELPSLLEPDGMQDLKKLAEWHFRRQRQIPQDSRLSEAGFAFEDDAFALPRHWGFTARGLVLHYNPGEVAPPKLGPTTILAPWNELRGIVSAKAGILPR
ncbi:MAG: RsiV family protein [Bryobacteraceae bacterium]|nr:RsiV family protein [Bryobacteraceae bacterium]